MPSLSSLSHSIPLPLVSEIVSGNVAAKRNDRAKRAVALALPIFPAACCRSVPDGNGSDCTSRQLNTHITESRVVLYPWHPWHGRTVSVFNTVAKNGDEVFRCGLESMETAWPLEVPQWMFDPAACFRIHFATSPAVNCEALLELKREAVLQAGHHSLPRTGGADATLYEPAAGGSCEAVEGYLKFDGFIRHTLSRFRRVAKLIVEPRYLATESGSRAESRTLLAGCAAQKLDHASAGCNEYS